MQKRITQATHFLQRSSLGITSRGIITLSKSDPRKDSELKELLHSLEQQTIPRDPATYARILQACSKLEALSEGKRVHAHIISGGLEGNPLLGNHIVNMYAKCGSPSDARAVFDKLVGRNVFSWTAVITAYAQTGHCKEALKLFRMMQLEGIRPDRVVFITVLDTCSCPESLDDGQMIHELVVESELDSDIVVGNALINMYGKCGSPESAQRTFKGMHERSIISWTSAIAANAQNGHGKEALHLFRQMQLAGVRPNLITLVTVLQACDSPSFLAEGRLVDSCILESGSNTDVVVGTALVDMYSKCKSLEDARKTFDGMQYRNVISWSAMIAANSEQGHAEEAVKLYHLMQLEGVWPDNVTFVTLLNACDAPEVLAEGNLIHARLVANGFELDIVLQNALVTMYGKCGDLEGAAAMFGRMQKRDDISWNALIAAYAQNEHVKETFAVFHQMLLSGTKPNKVTFVTMLSSCNILEDARTLHACIRESGLEGDVSVGTALSSAYGKCGSMQDADSIFNGMNEWNVVSCNAMVAGYSQQGLCKEALKVVQQMQQKGVKLNTVTFMALLEACAAVAAVAEGRRIHALIMQTNKGWESNPALGNSLVYMYGKCGRLSEAWRMFDEITQRDVVSWTVIVEIYAQHGHGEKALLLFHRMQQEGIKPNHISFINILSACSHAGLVREGCVLFESLIEDHGILPSATHYGCMIDLLGRAGQLELAEEFINRLPFQASAMTWMILLSACRNHGDVQRGKSAARRIRELDPSFQSGYVLLSNIYAEGMLEKTLHS